MNIRKLKRKCMVRGCKNTDTFAISNTREAGNSIVACKKCLEKALEAIKDYKEPEKDKKSVGIPSLFFSAPIEDKIAQDEPLTDSIEETEDETKETESTEEDTTEDTEEETSKEKFVCEKCGKEYATEKGLKVHESKCNK